MKLLSVKILGNNFRSLTANKLYKFNVSDREDRLSTKCFTGLNGSGKSNMLELIAEIFYFLDYQHLKHGEPDKKKGANFGFEIEYLLPYHFIRPLLESYLKSKLPASEWVLVRIIKPIEKDEKIEFSFRPYFGLTSQADNSSWLRIEDNTELLLPKHIIAYTSGQNELLSNPFYKLRYHHFREYQLEEDRKKVSDRLFFIDDVNNFNVFLANFLLGDKEKLKVMKKVYRITDLESFRITINLHNYDSKKIGFAEEINVIINQLIACATCWDTQLVYGKKKKEQLVLDYLVTDATKKAFAAQFDTAMQLFKALYQLEVMNIHMHRKYVQDLIHHAPKWLNVSDEIPKIDPDDQVFRLEKIVVSRSKKYDEELQYDNELSYDDSDSIRYKNLSDGEHQFNEVVGSLMLVEEEGCLFLLDEPDTHFNPKWRSKLISLFNEMACLKKNEKGKIEKVSNQEVIMTTHSPFAISDSFKEDVYVFEKTEKEVNLSNPKIPTYGASITVILDNVFKNDYSIATLANREIEAIKALAESADKVEEARASLNDFGESIERFNALRYIRQQEEKFRNNQ